MTVLTSIMTILSQVAAIILLVILACVCVEAVLSKWLELKDRNNWAQRTLGRKALANEIGWQAYWFSEEPKVMNALQVLSKHIKESDGGHFDSNNLRNEWREKCQLK